MSADEFEHATVWARSAQVPNDTDKLELYGLFKVASEASVPIKKRPAFYEFTERAKWDSWERIGKQLDGDALTAKQKYIELVKKLGWSAEDNHDSMSSQNSTTNTPKQSQSKGAVFVSTFAGDAINDVPSALHDYAEKGDFDALISINPSSTDVNERNSYGCTPLHLAADKGHVSTVKALLNLGADRSIQDNDGLTALDIAQVAEMPEIITLLEKES